MKVGSVIYKGFILLICIFGAGSSIGKTTIDALFQNAMEQVGQVSHEESIKAFEAIISKERDYAPAYNELAKLHLLDHSVNGRQRAMRRIQQAIAIDSDNIEYRLTRGKIWWHQGFRFRALNQFKNVIKKHPENTDVLNSLGMFLVYDFLSQKDRRAAFKEMEMGSSVFIDFWRMAMRSRIKDFKIFAQEAKQEAIQVLRKSIELDETNQQPYYLLGILYFEDKYWDAFHALMQALRAQYPDDKNALLFCGLAAYQLGEFNDSHDYYQRALDLMSVEERELLDSIDLLVSEEDQASRDKTQTIDALLEREMFWKRQDPLYLSDFNERKMAHFGRMAYANLRFRRFSDDVEGWQTDMGKTYIKFGRYRLRVTTYKGTWDSKEVLNATMMEFWYYENFQFIFCGTTDDIWHFCGGAVVEHPSAVPPVEMSAFTFDRLLSYVEPEGVRPYLMRRKSPSSFIPRTLTEAPHHIFRKTPQRFIDPYLQRKYTLPYQIAAFEEQNRMRVELSYMIPRDRLKENPETGKVSFWDGIFFFDQQWNDMYNDRKSRTLTLPPQKPVSNTAAQHRNDHLLISRTVPVRIDTLSPTLFASQSLISTMGKTEIDLQSEQTAEAQGLQTDRSEDSEASVSAFADSLMWGETKVYTSGGRVHHIPAEDLKIKRSKDGDLTRTVTANYEGNREDDFTYLQIDVNQVPEGIYQLTVLAKDKRTEQTDRKYVYFQVVE